MLVSQLLITVALCFAGFAALSMAMDRHFTQSTGRRGSVVPLRWSFRLTGCLFLVASLWSSVLAWGAVVGAVTWWGLLTIGALGVVIQLTYRPRMLPAFAAIAGLAALLALSARFLPA